MPRALITGITGQDGLYLSELLLEKEYEVYGLIRGQNNPKRDLVERAVPGVQLLTGDLTDLSSLIRALNAAQPDEVYNLGAISFVAYSWENARLTSEVTGLGVLNMLEATRLYAGTDMSCVRFYQASSSEMFGKVQEVPQRETTLLQVPIPVELVRMLAHAAHAAADLAHAVGALRDDPARAAAVAEGILDRQWDAEDAYANLIRARSRSDVPGAEGPAQRELARRAEDLTARVAHVARRVVHTVAKRS